MLLNLTPLKSCFFVSIKTNYVVSALRSQLKRLPTPTKICALKVQKKFRYISEYIAWVKKKTKLNIKVLGWIIKCLVTYKINVSMNKKQKLKQKAKTKTISLPWFTSIINHQENFSEQVWTGWFVHWFYSMSTHHEEWVIPLSEVYKLLYYDIAVSKFES